LETSIEAAGDNLEKKEDDTPRTPKTPTRRSQGYKPSSPEVELIYMPTPAAIDFQKSLPDQHKTLKRQNSSPSKMTSP
jgi:hypothetical protein